MLTVEVIYIHFCQTELKMNSQLSFQHVHNEPVYPASFDQVPGQASEMPGGAQQIIFVMFLQVLISGSVYLYTKRRVRFATLHLLILSMNLYLPKETDTQKLLLLDIKICIKTIRSSLLFTLMYSDESGSNWTKQRFNTCSCWSWENTI